MAETSKDLATNINTNITEHFFKRHFKYVKACFYGICWADAKKIQNKLIEEAEQTGGKGMSSLPQCDLTEESEPEMDGETSTVLQSTEETSSEPPKKGTNLAYDLKVEPHRFIKPMIFINKFLEQVAKDLEDTKGKKPKTFSVVPLVRSFVPQYIHITTPILERALINDDPLYKDNLKTINKERETTESLEKGKRKISGPPEDVPVPKRRKPGKNKSPEAMKEKDQIWNLVFNLKTIDNRKKGLTFGHHILTDGVGVSILYNDDKPVKEKKKKKDKKRKNQQTMKNQIFQNIKKRKLLELILENIQSSI